MVLKEACYKAGEFMFWLSYRVKVCTDYDRNVSRFHYAGTGPMMESSPPRLFPLRPMVASFSPKPVFCYLSRLYEMWLPP